MAATGVLAFVHPVSTPAVALSLWLGFWACLPPAWPTGRRCRHMALTAAAFLVSVAPYAILYLSGHAHGRASDPEIQRLVTYGAWNMVDVGGAARQFLAALWRLHVYVFLAVAGIVFTHRLGDRRRVAMVLLWAAGVVGASVVVPAAVRAYARYAGTLPLESQLTRNLRYLLPLILLFTLWPLAEWSRRTAREAWWRAVPLGLGIALTANWWDGHPPTDVVRNALRCWSRGRLLCPGTKYDRTEEAMEAVKRVVPEGVPIVTTRLEGQFRYATLRPLAYAYKHHEQFIYSNHERLREWDRKRRRMERALASATPRDRLRRLVKFAARCEAGFLLVHFRVRSGDLQGLPASLAWSNGQYSLVKLTAGTH
jgi:hypothetical protein